MCLYTQYDKAENASNICEFISATDILRTYKYSIPSLVKYSSKLCKRITTQCYGNSTNTAQMTVFIHTAFSIELLYQHKQSLKFSGHSMLRIELPSNSNIPSSNKSSSGWSALKVLETVE